MPHRFPGIFISLILVLGFVIGLFIQPTESRANPDTGWVGEYFANPALQGDPMVTVSDEVIDMNWFTGAPYENAGIPADFFSIRWTSNAEFSEGIYRFRVGADDGIRLYIDEKLIIDAVSRGEFRTHTRDVRLLAGEHHLRVEYFEGLGLAGVLVDWSLADVPGEVIDLETENIETLMPENPEAPVAYIVVSATDIRSMPYAGAERLTQAYLYQQYPIIGISADGSWYNIDLSNSISGWVAQRAVRRAGDDTLPVISFHSENTASSEIDGVAAADLKLRESADISEPVSIIPQGEQVEIISRNDRGTWLYVRWQDSEQRNSVEGWVYAAFVQISGNRLGSLEIR